MRQIDVSSHRMGIKVKGNELITRDEYLHWLIGFPNYEVIQMLNNISYSYGPVKLQISMEQLTGIMVSLVGECVDHFMSNPYPAKVNAKSIIEKYRDACSQPKAETRKTVG